MAIRTKAKTCIHQNPLYTDSKETLKCVPKEKYTRMFLTAWFIKEKIRTSTKEQIKIVIYVFQ